MTTPSAPRTGRRPTWRRKLLFISGLLLGLLVVVYFVVTSSAFFKGMILPRASKALGGEVTVTGASISPFSQVKLRQFTVRTTGTEPLLQAEAVAVRYHLFAILGGTLKVDEVTVDSPVVQIIENADGSSNLDPLLKKAAKPAAKAAASPAAKPASSKPPQIDLKNFALKNATIRHIKILKSGGREVTELTGVNITLDQLKNGQPGKLTTAAAFRMSRSTNDVLEAKSTGDIEFTLGADLMPQSLKATVEQDISRAEGSFRELAGIRTRLTGDVTPTEIKEFSERFLRDGQVLGEVKVSGPLDLAKKEGRLNLEVTSIDRQVLNLIGAPLGIDFGTTTLNATTEVTLTQGGSVITANTRFNAAKFSVTQKGQTTPPLDLALACNVTVNTAGESAEVQTFTLDGTQNQKPLLHGTLSKPMTVAWGKNAATTGDSALDLAVTDFDFAAWKPVLGDAVSAGRLSLQLNLLSEQGGRQLKLGVTSQIADLTAKLGKNPLTQAALQLKLNAQVNDFKKISLGDYRLELTQQAQPALTASGSASYDGAAFNLQTQVEAVMARLLGSGPATPLAAGVKLDGSFANQMLDLRQLQLTFAPTPKTPKNELTLAGRLDLSTPGTTKGSLTAKADTLDLTQLYDTFAGNKQAATKPDGTATTPAPASASNAGNVEPEPVTLPLQLTAEVNLGQVYLRDIALQNVQATTKVDGSRIILDPCRLLLNGAPVSATVDLNLGVKGYTYALNLQMDKVPLEPIASTFSPATRGQYQGLIIANAQIKGAGITGASLQKSLNGQASFSFTNADLKLSGPKTKQVIVPIATLLGVPEITQSPLDWLQAQTEMGGGNLTLTQFTAHSAAFEARTAGVIPIAEVLNNSPLNLPVGFALSRSLAERTGLLPANTPTNAAYAELPQFVTVTGTLGAPKSDLNRLALGGLLLKTGTGIAQKLGVKVDPNTANVLQGLGSLLTGQKPAANTNQISTNPPAKFNPLDLFQKK
jgi:type II secretion system protein N